MNTPTKSRVAVIGLGIAGITSVKNLVEQGFEDVTAYERNGHIGGLWQHNPDPKQTTALKSTKCNGSKLFSAYQDFPFPVDAPDYPSADQVVEYLNAYASQFDIERYFRLSTEIIHLGPAPDVDTSPSSSSSTGAVLAKKPQSKRWIVRIRDAKGERDEVFDKVLVTNGPWCRTYIPDLPGMDSFKGEILHAQAYKDPAMYKGKRVVIAGLGNTGGDIAVSLVGSAAKVYVSHRSGTRVMKRYGSGSKTPFDHKLTRRRWITGASMNARFPRLMNWVGSKVGEWMFKRSNPGYKPEWGFFPAPPLASSAPSMQDNLVDYMVEDKIHNLHGLEAFTPTGIRTRGKEKETECDVVIFSTGYSADLSFCSPEANPFAYPTPEWDALGKDNNMAQYPYLYQTIFHPAHADSLAFIGPCRGFSAIAFSNADSSAQAVSQVWKGSYTLPPEKEMVRWCDEQYVGSLQLAKKYKNTRTGIWPLTFERWLNDVVGNRCNEMFGWGWDAWKFWWNEHKLYGLIMDGVNTPHVYRLWDATREGSRKRWDGAREAIFRANGLDLPK